ncbi:MAG: hypothetical protein Kilf2KO_05950 [Rhodospirillales bacterium]
MSPLDRLALWLGRVLSVVFLLIALMLGWEVVVRYLFAAPTYWAHELAGILAAFAFVFGGAYCMAEGSHMRISLLLERLGPRGRKAVEIVSLLAGAIYLAGLTWAAWRMTEGSFLRFTDEGQWMAERSGSSWNTPAPAFVKLALLLGGGLFLLVLLRQLLRTLRSKA